MKSSAAILYPRRSSYALLAVTIAPIAFVVALWPRLTFAASNASNSAATSPATVAELLRVDNLAAAANAKADAAKLGVSGPDTSTIKSAPQRPMAPSIAVNAIYGLADDRRIDMVVDGSPLAAAKVGQNITPKCRIASIQDMCVHFDSPAPQEAPKKASRGKSPAPPKRGASVPAAPTPVPPPAPAFVVNPLLCPVSCWTGQTPSDTDAPAAGMPLPSPIPASSRPSPSGSSAAPAGAFVSDR